MEFPVTMSRLPSRLKSPITRDVGYESVVIYLRRLEAGLRRWRLVGHHAVVEENFHLAGVEAGNGDIVLAGVARIPNGDAVGIGAGRQSLTSGEPAAALPIENRDGVISIVGDGQVGNSVAVQIADGDLIRQMANRIGLRRSEGSAAAAVVQQHADGAIGRCWRSPGRA